MLRLNRADALSLAWLLLTVHVGGCMATPIRQRLRKSSSTTSQPENAHDLLRHPSGSIEPSTSTNKDEIDESDLIHDYIVRLLQGETQSMPLSSEGEDDSDTDVETETDNDVVTAGASTNTPTEEVVSTNSPDPGAPKRPPWSHELSDIPLDPNILVGELPNGLRYMAMENSEPPGRLELRLHVDAGSFQEVDGQEGIAHYLEHLAFQSLKNFPGVDLNEVMNNLGIDAFGGHSNAYTTFDETVYRLTLPQLDNVTVDTSFMVMRDYADGMLLLENEIETERGVVLSELQETDSVTDRIWRRFFPWALPDHLIPTRWPIGLEDTIRSVTQQQLVDFYNEFYTTRHITVVVVGDMNTTTMEDLIIEYFGSMVDAGELSAPSDLGTVPVGVGLRTAVFVDNELQGDELYIESTKAMVPSEPDSVAQRTERMKMDVCNNIIGQRLISISGNESSPIIWGGAYVDRWYGSVEFVDVWVQPKEGRWQEAVGVAEQELRRALTYGFLPSEVDRTKAEMLNNYEQQVLSKDTRQNFDLATYLQDSINGNYVVSTPEEDLRIASMVLENITPESLKDFYNSYWNTTDVNVFLTSSSTTIDEMDAARTLEALFLESQQVEVGPPIEPENASFAYTDFGTPGTVVSEMSQNDLDIQQMILSNNVRVNMKKTDFSDGSIQILARFGTGKLGQPTNSSLIDDFTAYMMTWGGLGEHSWEELDRVLAGKSWDFSFEVQDGAFVMSGTTNPDDLEIMLQVMTAHFVDPGFREEALGWWESDADGELTYLQNTLGGAYWYDMYGWLLGEDRRFIKPTEEDFFSFEVSDAVNWLVPQLENSYLEVSIVGDFDQTEAIDLVLKTFGALPERSDTPPQFTMDERAILIPPAPQTKLFSYESKVPNAATMMAWSIPPLLGPNITEFRHFQVLASILNTRVYNKIREELGLAYSPEAYADISSDFDYGFMFLYAEGLPEEMTPFADAMVAMAQNLTSNGGSVTETEVTQAVRPIQSNYQESLRSNDYWLFSVLQECQAEPFELDWARHYEEDYNNVTAAAINALVVKYLALDKALQITILPVDGLSPS